MTPSAADLAPLLEARFARRRRELLAARPADWTPGFDPQSAALRAGGWQVAPPPEELHARKVEQIVEASDAEALEVALTAGADALILDLDDTFSPTPGNVRAAYRLLSTLGERARPLILLRPRPLYMDDADGESATIRDLAAFVTAFPGREHLYLYIPKLEFVPEAEFWRDLLAELEEAAGRAPNSIRVCLQIETLPAIFHAEELLYALRERAFGLNAGRWDYVFSAVKWLDRAGRVLPPRAELHMGQPSMQAYERQLALVCARRGAQAIGGSAALAPDPQHPEAALSVVRADKEREAAQGFVAAWAGLPELVPTLREAFKSTPPADPAPVPSEAEQEAALLNFPPLQALPLEAVREAIGIASDYLRAWLSGRGVIVRAGRVEDTATAELARAQLWQWVRHGVRLDSSEALTPGRFTALLGEAGPPDAASDLLRALVLAEECPPYFPALARPQGEAVTP